MSTDCQVCPVLREQLAELRGQVAATAQLIDREQEKPTMARQRLLDAVRARLAYAVQGGAR